MNRKLLESCRAAMQYSQDNRLETDWRHMIASIDAELAKPERKPEQEQAGIPSQRKDHPVWVGGKHGVLGGWAFPAAQQEHKPDWKPSEMFSDSESGVLLVFPAWHDAPTCVGQWLLHAEETHIKRTYNITAGLLPVISKLGDRWYGPIPEDTP